MFAVKAVGTDACESSDEDEEPSAGEWTEADDGCKYACEFSVCEVFSGEVVVECSAGADVMVVASDGSRCIVYDEVDAAGSVSEGAAAYCEDSSAAASMCDGAWDSAEAHESADEDEYVSAVCVSEESGKESEAAALAAACDVDADVKSSVGSGSGLTSVVKLVEYGVVMSAAVADGGAAAGVYDVRKAKVANYSSEGSYGSSERSGATDSVGCGVVVYAGYLVAEYESECVVSGMCSG